MNHNGNQTVNTVLTKYTEICSLRKINVFQTLYMSKRQK